jgi:TusA-related sulfurtransferase
MPGGTLVLWSDDEKIVDDLPAWCEGQGHELVTLGRDRSPAGGIAWRGEIRLRR